MIGDEGEERRDILRRRRGVDRDGREGQHGEDDGTNRFHTPGSGWSVVSMVIGQVCH